MVQIYMTLGGGRKAKFCIRSNKQNSVQKPLSRCFKCLQCFLLVQLEDTFMGFKIGANKSREYILTMEKEDIEILSNIVKSLKYRYCRTPPTTDLASFQMESRTCESANE